MTPETFPRQQDALVWLHEHFGCPYPSAGKFSQDCKNGLCLVQPNKTYRSKDVKAYAERIKHDKRSATVAEGRAAEREELEIRKLKLEVEKRELENRREDDKWLAKEEAWAQLAALVGTLRDALRHQCHVGQAHLVHLAGGDPSRGPEVYEGLEEIIARAFNEVVTAGHIEGVFEVEEP